MHCVRRTSYTVHCTPYTLYGVRCTAVVKVTNMRYRVLLEDICALSPHSVVVVNVADQGLGPGSTLSGVA